MDPTISEISSRLDEAFELLARQDLFGTALRLQTIRRLLASLAAAIPKEEDRDEGDMSHDWRVADPYTAECRLCGKQMPLGAHFLRLDPATRISPL